MPRLAPRPLQKFGNETPPPPCKGVRTSCPLPVPTPVKLDHTHPHNVETKCTLLCSLTDPAPKGNLASKCLAHINLIGAQQRSKKEAHEQATKENGPLPIGAGLPPVPQKLVSRIHAGEFVDMSELLPDRLGVNSCLPLDSDEDDKCNRKTQTPPSHQLSGMYAMFQCVHGSTHQSGPGTHPRSSRVPGPD